MACSSITAPSPSLNAAPWRATLEPPRGPRKSIYLRARRTNPETGKREEERFSLDTLDPAEAQRLLVGYLARRNGTAPTSADPTVLDVLDARLASMVHDPEFDAGTLKVYRSVRRALADLPLASLRGSTLTPAAVAAARDVLKARHTANTANSYLAKLAATWRWAYDPERSLVTVAWPKVKGVTVGAKPARDRRAYDVGEVDQVLAYFHAKEPSWAFAFELLAATGARLNEVLSRKAEDVDRSRCTIRLRCSETKTDEARDVGFPARLLPFVPERVAGAYLFPSPSVPDAHLTDRAALRALRRALDALAIADPEALDVHSFRRSFCVDGPRAGIPDADVMAQSGHRSKRVFHDSYASKGRADNHAVAEGVDAYRSRERAKRSTPAPVVHGCSTRGQTREPKSQPRKGGEDGSEPGTVSVLSTPTPDVSATCPLAAEDNAHGRSLPLVAARGLSGDEDHEALVARITARAVASVLTDPDVVKLLSARPALRVLSGRGA